MKVEQIDRQTGEQVKLLTGEGFGKLLRKGEDPRIAEECYGDVLMGGVYCTAEYMYRQPFASKPPY